MRIITWNIHCANKDSPVWELLFELQPDIALLQEVGSVPEEANKLFSVLAKQAINKTGKPQRFSTAVLVKGKIIQEITLSSEYAWVNTELEFFKGNFISCLVQPANQKPMHVVSVYCPAWPVDTNRLQGIDVSPVRLTLIPNVWPTEIIWSALKKTVSHNERWIVGGDYNSSETFDAEWQRKNGVRTGLVSHGNKEVLDRMYALGFKECLREYSRNLVPTFQNVHDKKVIHQLDHLFVTSNLYAQLERCVVGDKSVVFGQSLSDHLPIIADFG